MSNTPKVTVLMPVYDAAKYLREAIDSILAQSFRNFEFLVIDDGSTDDSRAIIESYEDPRIRVVYNSRNLGLVETLNRGLMLASGEFVARMDADDRALPNRLNRQVACLNDDPTIGLVGTCVEIIDERGRRRLMVRDVPSSHNLICWNLLFENCVAHSSVMLRRSAVFAAGGYTKGIWAEDYELWVRMSRLCQIVQLPEVLQQFRINMAGTFVAHRDQHEAWCLRVMEDQAMRLLGRSVCRESLDFLRRASRFESLPYGGALSRASELILEYFQCFVDSRRLADEELRLVRTNVGVRLFALASVNLRQFPVPALHLAISNACFSPRSLMHRHTIRGILHAVGGPGMVERLKWVLTRA